MPKSEEGTALTAAPFSHRYYGPAIGKYLENLFLKNKLIYLKYF